MTGQEPDTSRRVHKPADPTRLREIEKREVSRFSLYELASDNPTIPRAEYEKWKRGEMEIFPDGINTHEGPSD